MRDDLLKLISDNVAEKVLSCLGNSNRLNILLALLKKGNPRQLRYQDEGRKDDRKSIQMGVIVGGWNCINLMSYHSDATLCPLPTRALGSPR